MLLKLLLTAVVLLVVWGVFFRRPRAEGQRRVPRAMSLIKCPNCGVHRLPGGSCACKRISRD